MRGLAKLAAAGGGVGAALVIGASGAFACTSLATITPSTPSGNPGSSVTVTGTAFDPAGGPVALHWNSMQGPALAQAKPDAGGGITAAITVPKDALAGYYVIIATQTEKDGSMAFGTPARTSFQVGAPGTPSSTGMMHGQVASSTSATQNVATATVANRPADNTGWVVALATLGVLGTVLFVGGLAFFITEVRRSAQVALARR
jgi:hypothetical protein